MYHNVFVFPENFNLGNMFSISETAGILDMDDKWLVEVFKHLKLVDLCTVL